MLTVKTALTKIPNSEKKLRNRNSLIKWQAQKFKNIKRKIISIIFLIGTGISEKANCGLNLAKLNKIYFY